MSEKRMLILEADVVTRIDENRGDMSVSDFIRFLIESQLNQGVNGQGNNHITKEEFHQFEQGIRELLRNFLEFFLSYGLELGKQSLSYGLELGKQSPDDKELETMIQKLQALAASAKAKKSVL